MAYKIKSKHAVVSRPPYALFMAFTDMRNFVNMLPEEKRGNVKADFDTLETTVQGFTIGVKVSDRVPYSRISYSDNGAPFSFNVNLCFDSSNGAMDKTDFHIDLDADLNFMMRMMLGGKLQDGVDKIVDGIAALCDGKIPEGIDPSVFKEAGVDPSAFSSGTGYATGAESSGSSEEGKNRG